MTPRSYTSPAPFKQALEQRLRDASLSGKDFARRRQRLVFERFMARVDELFVSVVTLSDGDPVALVDGDLVARRPALATAPHSLAGGADRLRPAGCGCMGGRAEAA